MRLKPGGWIIPWPNLVNIMLIFTNLHKASKLYSTGPNCSLLKFSSVVWPAVNFGERRFPFLAVLTLIVGHSFFTHTTFRFIVKGCSDSKLTWIFGTCMIFSPISPNFITLGQGVHENRPSYIGHSKNEILGEIPLNMTWIADFPCLVHNFSICYHLIFVVSPDWFYSNLKIFL